MTFSEAETIFDDIVKSTAGDDDLRPLHREFVLLAIRYARMRTDWRMASLDDRRAMDKARSTAHDTFIDACNILSRACLKKQRSNAWREQLGENRKEIGDFACHLHALLGILAR